MQIPTGFENMSIYKLSFKPLPVPWGEDKTAQWSFGQRMMIVFLCGPFIQATVLIAFFFQIISPPIKWLYNSLGTK